MTAEATSSRKKVVSFKNKRRNVVTSHNEDNQLIINLCDMAVADGTVRRKRVVVTGFAA